MILSAGWQLQLCRPHSPAATSSAAWPLGFSNWERRRGSQGHCIRAAGIWDSAPLRVHIRSDDGGVALKEYLITALTEGGHVLVGHGPHPYDAEDDYPVFCIPT